MDAVEHFSTAFSAPHRAWASSNYAWDPSSLVAVPGRDGVRSSPSVEGDNGPDADRDQSLGPTPTNWKAPGARNAGAESKAHSRLPKTLVCQVEGCGHDLSGEKGYYQRYRICEPHVKLLTVEVEGRACRFCQQCGRFHELSEFDGTKRSCRARLLLHNARRRKRDPVDASNKEPRSQRKAKATHPRSDDSNDNELDSRGSFGASHGTWPASGAPTSAPVTEAEPAATPAVSSGAVPKLTTRAGLNDQSLPLPGFQQPMAQSLQQAGGAPAPAAFVPALGKGSGVKPEPLGPTADATARPAGAVMQRESLPIDFARAFSDDTDLPLVDALKLDDFMLDGIMAMDYIDELPGPRPMMPVGLAGLGPAGAATTLGAGLPGNGRREQQQLQLQPPPPPQQQQQQQQQAAPLQGQRLTMAGPVAGYSPMLGTNQTMLAAGLMPPAGAASLPAPSMPMSGDVSMSPAVPRAVLNEQLQMQEIADAQRRLLQSAGVLPGPSHQGTFLAEPQPANDGPNSGMSVCSLGGGFTSPSSSSMSNPLGSGFGAPPHSSTGNQNVMLSSGVTLNVPAAMVSPINVAPCMAQVQLQAQAPFGAVGGGMSSFDMARRLVEGGGAAVQYRSDDFLVRVSIKVANCTPDELPPDLYQRLQSLLATADASLIQGFLRPGCTHLVLDARGGEGSQQALSAAGVRAALGPVAQLHSTLVQVGEEVAMWAEGVSASAQPASAARVPELEAAGAVPVLHHVSPAAHLRHSAAGDSSSASVVVYGSGLVKAGVQLFARMQGGYLPVRVQPLVAEGQLIAQDGAAAAALQVLAQLVQAGRSATDALLVSVDAAPASGLLLLEAQAGPLLSAWRPCLLSVDSAMATELAAAGSEALTAGGNQLQSLESFVADLGRLVDACSFAKAGTADAEEAVSMERVCACEQMLAWAAEAGLPAVSSFLVHTLLQSGQELGAVLEAPYADGLSVLHRAVRSRSEAMVRAVLGWAAREGVELSWRGEEAVGQLSPLHLAALVPAAWRALAAEPAVQRAWARERATDGATPALLRQILFSRLRAVNALRASVPVAEIAVAAGAQAEAAQASTTPPTPETSEQVAAPSAAAAVAAPVRADAVPPAPTQPASILRSALPLMAVLTTLTYIGLVPTLSASYLPIGITMCVLACALSVLLITATARPEHDTLTSKLASPLPPVFASARLEAAYQTRASVSASQLQRDAAALLVLLAMCVAAARLPGASAFAAAVNVGLTLLPLAAMRLSREGYIRVRDMALVGAYVAMLNAICSTAQVLLAEPPRCRCAMLFIAVTAAMGAVAPINTSGMLFTLAYTVSMAMRAWTQKQGLLGGAPSVTAAEACGAAQMGVIATATAVSYASELVARQRWLTSANKAALGKFE